MIKEAVILAGGLGTRLRSVIKDIPKPIAEVCGRPFLCYILDFLYTQGIERVILSVGYKWEIIRNFFGNQYKNLKLEYAIEDKPLGTGGGLKNALKYVYEEEVFVLNGDTFFDIDLNLFYNLHKSKNSKLSIALKKTENTERYGIVEIDENNRIVSFLEKGKRVSGFINGGIYLLNKNFFNAVMQEDTFSLEKDFLEKHYKDYEFYGFSFDGFFIDIGIPEDYERTKYECKRLYLNKD
jgi:D-glycero-alpha-D-manno-heptose 1-phosphate guanylyltransferase